MWQLLHKSYFSKLTKAVAHGVYLTLNMNKALKGDNTLRSKYLLFLSPQKQKNIFHSLHSFILKFILLEKYG